MLPRSESRPSSGLLFNYSSSNNQRRLVLAGLSPWQSAFSEGLGDNLPIIFVDQVPRFDCLDLLHIDAVSFQDANHLPYACNVLGCSHLEPTNAQAKPAPSEGRRLFQILAEPISQGMKFVRIRACDCFQFERTRYGLEDSLFNVAVLVFLANNKPDTSK